MQPQLLAVKQRMNNAECSKQMQPKPHDGYNF